MVETLESIYIAAKFMHDLEQPEADEKRKQISLMVLYRGDYFEVTAKSLACHFEPLLDKMVGIMGEIVRRTGLEKRKAMVSFSYESKTLHYVVDIKPISLPASYLPFKKYVYVLRASERPPETIDLEPDLNDSVDLVKIEVESANIWAETHKTNSKASELNNSSEVPVK